MSANAPLIRIQYDQKLHNRKRFLTFYFICNEHRFSLPEIFSNLDSCGAFK